jgi:hypothetical protein
VRDLLGGPEAPWAYSRIYFGSGDKLRSIDMGRINPVSSPLLEFLQRGPKAGAVVFSPVAQALVDQVYGESAFTGRKFTGHGSAQEGSGLDSESRARIAAGDLLASQLSPFVPRGDTAIFAARAARERKGKKRRGGGSGGGIPLGGGGGGSIPLSGGSGRSIPIG